MTKRNTVVTQRLSEDQMVAKAIKWPIVAVVAGVIGLYWVFNHVSGGCVELKDWISYCEFRTHL